MYNLKINFTDVLFNFIRQKVTDFATDILDILGFVHGSIYRYSTYIDFAYYSPRIK